MTQRTAQREGEWVEMACAFCEGTGKNPSSSARCPVCGARRKVKVKTPYYRCAFCRGTGASGGTMTCTICKGRGVVTVEGPVEACPACRGYGRDINSPLRLSCPVCEGKGIVSS